ncbi:MAG: accessory gene regulator B family protein [Longicatena sp.]
MIKKFVGYLEDNGVIDNQQIEEYVYGFEVLKLKIIHSFLIMLIAFYTGKFIPILLFLYLFSSVRSLIGGKHAKSKYVCLFISLMMTMFACFILEKNSLPNWLFVIGIFILILKIGYIIKSKMFSKNILYISFLLTLIAFILDMEQILIVIYLALLFSLLLYLMYHDL